MFMTSNTTSLLELNVYMPNTTTAQAMALLSPFLNASLGLPGVSLVNQQYITQNINDAMYLADDSEGANIAMGSRLIPASTYRDAPETVGKVYKELLDAGTPECVSGAVKLTRLSPFLSQDCERHRRRRFVFVSVVSVYYLNCCTGQVAANANISAAINPAWRTAKSLVRRSIFIAHHLQG
jgi:hypothetical protein